VWFFAKVSKFEQTRPEHFSTLARLGISDWLLGKQTLGSPKWQLWLASER
jgi:hypothetical protein